MDRQRSDSDKRSDIIFGHWAVLEALKSGGVEKLFLAYGLRQNHAKEILDLAKKAKVPFRWVERRRLDEMTPEAHQGFVAQGRAVSTIGLNEILEKSLSANCKGISLLFLDGVLDPHNVGALIRSSLYFGVAGVVVPKWRQAPLTGTVLKASAGAARVVPVAQVSNLAQALDRAREKGFWIAGADMDGSPVDKADIPHLCCLVLGSEGEGLRPLVKKKCDLLVGIPKLGPTSDVDSLNVSAAGAILMYQLSR